MRSITRRIDNVTHINKEQLSTLPPPPIAVKIELTANCDFQCWFCATDKNLRDKKRMDFRLYKRLVKEMVGYGVKELGLFYLGESMLYHKLPEAIEYAKEVGMEYVFLTTNGFRADKEKLRKLFNVGLDSLKFSFNYPNRKECMKTTGVDAYHNIVTNIREAYKLRNKWDYNVGIYASTVEYSTDARNEMKEALNKIKPYIDEHYWLPLYNQGGFVKDKTNEMDVAGNTGRADAQVDGQCCWSLFTSAHITYDGLMTACCFDHNGSFIMGDLKYRRFGVIVYSDDFLAVGHAGLMLNRSADSNGDIQARSNRRSGLADLMVMVDKAQIHRSSCRRRRCA